MSPGASGGTVVSVYGGQTWLRAAATGLAEAGVLHSYISSVIASPQLERRVQRLPGPVARPVLRQVRLRPIPPGVPADATRLAGTVFELAAVAAIRASIPSRVEIEVWGAAGAAFDRGASRRLDGTAGSVLAPMGASMRTLARAKELGAHAVLDYPIAHHAYAERILLEEERLVPEFADTLQFHRLSRWHRRRLDREIRIADRVLVLSSFERRTFVEAGVPESKLITTPLGVDPEVFRREGDTGGGERFRVMFAGQIGQRKGISYLMDAFEQAAIPDSELVLVGRPTGSEVWHGRSGVRHQPPIPYPELPALYRGADVFVLPSLVEGFPQTPIQAMACGVPTIVSENTFAEDVITDGKDGYIVPIRDTAAIAERLRHLHENPAERSRIGRAGAERAGDFTWKRYGERVAEAVRSLD